jgi:hypothetical protein
VACRPAVKPEDGAHPEVSFVMTTHSVNILHSTVDIIGGNQANYNNTSNPISVSGAPPPLSPFNDAPDLLSSHFTGRENQLKHISSAFEHIGDIPRRCALYGGPGVGKSQLTYGWAKLTFDQKQHAYIFWISATTVEKLNQGFSKLLHLIQHPDRSHPEQSVRLIAARRWLEDVDSGNWLMVLDNVHLETIAFLREHLPRKNGRGSLLFTTRAKDVATALASAGGQRHNVVEVPFLNVQDSVKLFLQHFDGSKMETQMVELEEMMKALGGLPLAISHAAAYMKNTGCTVKDMLEVYWGSRKIDVRYLTSRGMP